MKKHFTFLLFLLGISTMAFCQDFYDILTIETIEITFEDEDWDSTMDTYYANDEGEKLMGSVVINGLEYDSIGVKYKGNSTYSTSNAKNPLHIYLDYMIDDQNYEGYESIKLSNGKNDPSFIREVLSYEIARKYTAAPLSNYAKVYINDEYYGMFSNSEAINSDFTETRLYADDDNVRIKCNPEDTSVGDGSSLMYLSSDSTDYYDYYEVKSDYGWNDLIDLTYDLKYNEDDIESTLDIDRAIWMMAFNNVTVNLDSYIGIYRQNYYLIKDDNGVFLPVIWDLNESLGAFETITESTNSGPGSSSSSTELYEVDPFLREDDSTYPLLEVIYDNDRYRKMYVAHCKTILEENFETGWYEAKADTLQALIADDLDDDDNKFYTMSEFYGNIDDTENNTIGITELMEDRITFLNNETEFNYTQPTISTITTPDDVTAYSTITITVEVTDANYVHLGYRYSKDETFTKIEMYDDGEHEDGAADDDVYGVSLTVDESNTHYYIYAENDDAGIFSPERAQHEYYSITAVTDTEESSDIVINELMASNETTAADQDGEYDDWIELYNNTDADISLSGYYLSDDEDELTQWAFPDTTIAADSYLIVWADKDDEQTGLHADFKLSSDGEGVYLTNSEYTVVNYTTFETQTDDMGYARVPNATGDFEIQDPTFSANNGTTSSIYDNELEGFSIYPNPAINSLYVRSDDQVYAKNTITITNLIGQTVYRKTFTYQSEMEIDASTFTWGIYILQLENESGTYTVKFIKK